MSMSGARAGRKIAVAGPGRSGTTLLVKLLKELGFSTPEDDSELPGVHAGLESRIGFGSPFDVDKDPWLFNYASSISDSAWSEYAVLIIPIRRLFDATVSRSKNERVARIMDNPESDYWSWDVGGRERGGAVSKTNAAAIGSVLTEGLWELLEVVSRQSIPVVFLNFPLFARDVDYSWSRLQPFIEPRVSEDAFRRAFAQTVVSEQARDYSEAHYESREDVGLHETELLAIVDSLREHVTALTRDVSSANEQREDLEEQIRRAKAAEQEMSTQIEQLRKTALGAQRDDAVREELTQLREDVIRHMTLRDDATKSTVDDIVQKIAQNDSATRSTISEIARKSDELANEVHAVSVALDTIAASIERSNRSWMSKVAGFLRRAVRRSER